MQRIRYGFIVLAMLLCSVTSAEAEVSIGIGIGFPHVSIGINLPLYPELVPVRGYPVYYAPRLRANYFFYDGVYWVYENDNWYASSWYNGPWRVVEPYYVPVFILRVPVRYYRQPPVYFRGWRSSAPPRWGHHWGPDWENRRRGWDRWERRAVPARAPLPTYQRQYSGKRYPRVEEQQTIHSKQYRYQPRDKEVREHFQRLEQAPAPAQREREDESRGTKPRQQDGPDGARSQPQPQGDEDIQKSAPDKKAPQQREPATRDQRQRDSQRPTPSQPQPQGDEDIQKSTPDKKALQQREPANRDQRQRDSRRPTPSQQDGPEGARSQPQPRGDEDIQKSAPDKKAPQQREPAIREQRRRDSQRPTPSQQDGPKGARSQPQPRGDENIQKSAPAQSPPQQRGPAIQEQRQQPDAVQREQRAPKSKAQEREDDKKRKDSDEERGQGRID